MNKSEMTNWLIEKCKPSNPQKFHNVCMKHTRNMLAKYVSYLESFPDHTEFIIQLIYR